MCVFISDHFLTLMVFTQELLQAIDGENIVVIVKYFTNECVFNNLIHFTVYIRKITLNILVAVVFAIGKIKTA